MPSGAATIDADCLDLEPADAVLSDEALEALATLLVASLDDEGLNDA